MLYLSHNPIKVALNVKEEGDYFKMPNLCNSTTQL